MPSDGSRLRISSALIISLSFLAPSVQSSVLISRSSDKPIVTGVLTDKAFLPAQIGGIVGAYAVSLVLVAITLLALSKRRRDHIINGHYESDSFLVKKDITSPDFTQPSPQKQRTFSTLNIVTEHNQALESLRTPTTPSSWISPSPVSSLGAPGVNRFVDQSRVLEDRAMAQSQLEEMYKHVLEYEDAKKRGIEYEVPALPTPTHQMRSPTSVHSLHSPTPSKKERFKPAGLNLRDGEKTQSRTSSLLSALRSPGRKKALKAVSISSPIMTPQSATFPREESQEMDTIHSRRYAPAPPVSQEQVAFGASRTHQPPPADLSPDTNRSIDECIGSQLPVSRTQSHTRTVSQALTEAEPVSASSEHSQSALVSLPASPKPGARFSTLPASPKPGQTFNRNIPTAVRTGGSLPLRAYEPAVNSPTTIAHTTKQTVFERRGPLSPGGGMTPFTGTAVPYSPYQPFTPCVPMTPSLVTKQDRKRMKKMVPKTPTMAMVKSEDEMW